MQDVRPESVERSAHGVRMCREAILSQRATGDHEGKRSGWNSITRYAGDSMRSLHDGICMRHLSCRCRSRSSWWLDMRAGVSAGAANGRSTASRSTVRRVARCASMNRSRTNGYASRSPMRWGMKSPVTAMASMPMPMARVTIPASVRPIWWHWSY